LATAAIPGWSSKTFIGSWADIEEDDELDFDTLIRKHEQSRMDGRAAEREETISLVREALACAPAAVEEGQQPAKETADSEASQSKPSNAQTGGALSSCVREANPQEKLAGKQARPELRKSRIACRAFLTTGVCKFGDQCRYAHVRKSHVRGRSVDEMISQFQQFQKDLQPTRQSNIKSIEEMMAKFQQFQQSLENQTEMGRTHKNTLTKSASASSLSHSPRGHRRQISTDSEYISDESCLSTPVLTPTFMSPLVQLGSQEEEEEAHAAQPSPCSSTDTSKDPSEASKAQELLEEEPGSPCSSGSSAHANPRENVACKQPESRKSRIACRAFLSTGVCKFGDQCRYAHVRKSHVRGKSVDEMMSQFLQFQQSVGMAAEEPEAAREDKVGSNQVEGVEAGTGDEAGRRDQVRARQLSLVEPCAEQCVEEDAARQASDANASLIAEPCAGQDVEEAHLAGQAPIANEAVAMNECLPVQEPDCTVADAAVQTSWEDEIIEQEAAVATCDVEIDEDDHSEAKKKTRARGKPSGKKKKVHPIESQKVVSQPEPAVPAVAVPWMDSKVMAVCAVCCLVILQIWYRWWGCRLETLSCHR